MATNIYDVAIVGAGPGGSTLAYSLAKKGIKTLLLDRAHFPRKKPCGGACDGLFFKYLPQGMSIEPVIENWCKIAYVSYKREYLESFLIDPPMAMTQRSELDHCLLKQAIEAGAEFRGGAPVKGILKSGEAYNLETHTETGYRSYLAKVVVGADGAYSNVARCLGYKTPQHQYVLSELDLPYESQSPDMRSQAQDSALADISTNPLTYWWQFSKKDHFNVGFGVPRPMAKVLSSPDLFEQYTSRWGLELNEKDWNKRVSHMIPFARRGYEVTKGTSLLIGDAAGVVDPSTGAGISWAVESGQIAKDFITAHLAGLPFSLSGYQSWFNHLLKEFEAGEAIRNVAVLALKTHKYKLASSCFQETLNYAKGLRSYRDWAKEHPLLFRIGRSIQWAIVNQAFR